MEMKLFNDEGKEIAVWDVAGYQELFELRKDVDNLILVVECLNPSRNGKSGKIKVRRNVTKLLGDLYSKLTVWSGDSKYAHQAPLETMRSVAKDLGIKNYELALYLIGYVGTEEAIEYANKELGYDFAIDTFLEAIAGDE